MKSKTFLIIGVVSPLFLIVAFFNLNSSEQVSTYAASNFKKCVSTNFLLTEVDTTRPIAPLFNDLGDLNYTVSTKNKKAQAFFNQGLKLTYAFNHAESHRSFMESGRLDNNLAMAYWGQAYSLGPNINDQLPDEERSLKAYEAIQNALKLIDKSSKKEQLLINALSTRYSKDSENREELNMAYMLAMEKVVNEFPNDVDILTLYAASVMNTVPWNYWDNDGNPSPNITEAKAALEKAIKIDDYHPGAHHYYIHMVELPKPDLGIQSADKLGTTMPGAGHIVHMPGHIYMRVGRYDDAVRVNEDAILADESYISQCFSQGLYPLGYYPHNIHFLWSAASMQGNSIKAIAAAKKTAEKVPANSLSGSQFHQNFAATPLLAYTRFGKWNDILTTPDPGDNLTYLKLIWHYSRGIAFLRKNNLKEAKEELELLANRNTEEDDERASTVANVAYEILAGEIEVYKGNLENGINHLKNAVAFEDELPYDEPAAWYIPSRQTLGAFLNKAKKYNEAEIIYLQDLDYYRANGWSLMGLYTSQLGQGKIEEAKKTKKAFDQAWSNADIEINNSIL
ncbi:tetratricopeptide repeat protein [Urechidicola vernalis]|uniref:Tetratricopeptide repeat protein n=1 Tax=Urechidicola vernalis TaxID=3075600 RepID=A0ABU2Y490_9FLAO|nr:hypothetical protein [Urechidicola sp. P050]MDT0553014.1 hypothetical protein [Urechidicola sp. P050]